MPDRPGQPGFRPSGDLDRTAWQAIASVQAERRLPAISAALGRDGSPRWTGAIGLADVEAGTPPVPDTAYRLGSITKTFTAVLVMQLRDEGRLALDDPLDRHLPGSAHGGSTVRRLLSHLSGLQREPPGTRWETLAGVSRDDLLGGLAQAEPVLPPGRRHHYSNLGFALLGEVVARLSGASWEETLRRRLLGPLGLEHTSVAPVPPAARGYFVHPYADRATPEPEFPLHGMAAAGQLWSTTADMLRWGDFLADPDPALLSRDTLEEMAEPQVMADGERWSLAWGLGLMLYRRGEQVLVGHAGGMPGFLAGLAVRRAERTVGVVFTNSGTGPLCDQLACDLVLAGLAAEPPAPRPWLPAPAEPAELAELVGSWWSEGDEYVFYVRDGRLQARPVLVPGEPAVFAPAGDDRFRGVEGREVGELLEVCRGADGTVELLRWASYPCHRSPRGFAG